jgi:superfamily II DNA or RNA helicase
MWTWSVRLYSQIAEALTEQQQAGRFFCFKFDIFIVVKLRPYQEECIRICLEEYTKGIRRQAVSLPVGSGKTVRQINLALCSFLGRFCQFDSQAA